MSEWIPEGTIVGGRWRIIGVLGEGGFGQVFLAEDESGVGLGRGAVKVLHAETSPKERQDFLDEIKKMALLRHQNLVGYLDSGLLRFDGEGLPDHGGDIRPFLVTELCDGSLRDRLRVSPGERLTPPETRRVLGDVATGLAHLHERGMIHRDIKPGNVLVAGHTWKLADFGLTRDLTATGTYHRGELLMGTPVFMAPELFTTMSATPPSDVYAFGVLAHLVAAGQPIHRGSGTALIRNITSTSPTIAPGLDAGLARVITACLDPRPEHRPAAGQLLGLLEALGTSGASGPSGTVAVAPPPSAPPSAPSSVPVAWPGPAASLQDLPTHITPPDPIPVAIGAGGPSGPTRHRPALLVIGAAVAAVLAGGVGIVALLNRGGGDAGLASGTAPTSAATQDTGGDGQTSDGDPGDDVSVDGVSAGEGVSVGEGVSIGEDPPSTTAAEAIGLSADDAISHFATVPCATGPGTLVELTNRHAEPVDYLIAADHLDAAGTTIAESYKNVLALEPGQTALVDLTSSEDDATACNLTALTATPTSAEVLAAADLVEIVSCDLDEFFGNWYDIVYTVENPNDFAAEAEVAFGIVDAEGVRIDESFTNLTFDIAPGQRTREQTSEVYRNMDLTDREPVACVVTWVEVGPWP